MEQPPEQPIKVLKTQITDYIEIRGEHTRLSLIESTAKITAYLSSTLIVIVLAMFFVLSLFVAVSFFFGQLLGNYGLGFVLSALLYLLILLIFIFLFKKKMERFVINKIIKITND